MERHVPKDPEADHAEWQLFFEEGDMRVFKRDSEENGMIIYPVKVVTKVKVSLSIIYISIAHLRGGGHLIPHANFKISTSLSLNNLHTCREINISEYYFLPINLISDQYLTYYRTL